jgi:hypothetical protein
MDPYSTSSRSRQSFILYCVPGPALAPNLIYGTLAPPPRAPEKYQGCTLPVLAISNPMSSKTGEVTHSPSEGYPIIGVVV